ncbi:MAG: mechanosensitive ion channel family protein, partial [Phycisphaerae bacterium]
DKAAHDTSTRPTTQPAARSSAHLALNDFMQLYHKGDAESIGRMVAYLDQSLLDDEAKANVATLAQRLAQFMDENKIATQEAFERLKLHKSATEHCLYEMLETEAPQGGAAKSDEEPTASDKPKKVCRIRLVKQIESDGLWQFDKETVLGIPLLVAHPTPARAEPKPVEVKPAAPTEPTPVDKAAPRVWRDYASPRTTMQTFLEALQAGKNTYNEAFAASCLNLKSWAVRENDRRAKLLATALKFVLDRTVYVQYLDLPDDPNTRSPYLYRTVAEGWNIEFERVEDGRWLFSTRTLDHLRDMCRAVAESAPKVPNAPELSFRTMPELWLFLKVPKPALRSVWGLELWQWLGLLLVLLAGVLGDRLARIVLRRISARIVKRLKARIDTSLESSALRPIGLVILGAMWLEFFQWLWLPKTLGNILTNGARVVVVVASVWAAYRVIDLVSGYLTAVMSRRASKLDALVVPFMRKLLKVLVSVGGVVYVASRLYPEEYKTILGGLGIGGLALALAAQEVIKNLFGSITVMVDRPFEIGDWVKIGDVEGTVEAVGFRSTRVRTFYNSQINVPNGKLIDAVVDNLGRRRYRRIRCQLGLTYDTPPEKIEAFCEGVRELIRRHPFTRKDYYHVYFNEFGPSSLNVLLYCFHEAPDWGTELRERHRLFLDIIRLAHRLGVEFAFPTQTLHLHNADAPADRAPDLPDEAAALAPDVLGRSEAAAIAKVTLPPPENLGPADIPREPLPVDEAYVGRRLGAGKPGRSGQAK